MAQPVKLETERLIMRQWRDEDYLPFARMNADPSVMEFFPATLNRDESDDLADTARGLIQQQGWGSWALELKQGGGFIGFTGLHIPTYDLPFNPCVEIGWRLARHAWGHGYATEAARAALAFGFEQLQLEEIVSFTSLLNLRSQAVMQRLHMVNHNENFIHPALPEGHLLSEHVLYRLSRQRWDRYRGQ